MKDVFRKNNPISDNFAKISFTKRKKFLIIKVKRERLYDYYFYEIGRRTPPHARKRKIAACRRGV